MDTWLEIMKFKEIIDLEETSSVKGWFFNVQTTEGIAIGQLQIHLTADGYLLFRYQKDEIKINIYPINRKAIFTSLTEMVENIQESSDMYDLILPTIIPPPAGVDIPFDNKTKSSA